MASDTLRTAKQLLLHCQQESPPPSQRFKELSPAEKEILLLAFDGIPTRVAKAISLPGHHVAGSQITIECRADGIDPRSLRGTDPSLYTLDTERASDAALNAEYHQKHSERVEKENHALRQYYAQFIDLYSPLIPKLDTAIVDYPHDWDKKNDEELAMLFLSDMHLGERVTLEDSSGLNVFNMDVFKERCDRYKAGVDSIINGILRKSLPIKHCYLTLLGDLVTGENIFPLQMAHLDRLMFEQIMEGLHWIADIIRFVATIFDRVTCYMVPGNHGSGPNSTMNTDYLLYHFLALALVNQPNLQINISDSDYCGIYLNEGLDVIPFLGSDRTWNYLFAHGNQARAWNGIPYYGLDRMTDRLNQSMGVIWDKTFVGHHHRDAAGEKWEIVGSWVGANDFSLKVMHAASRPSQLLRCFHPKQGLTSRYEIYLDDKPKLKIEEGDTTGAYTPTGRFLDVINASGRVETGSDE